MKKTTRATQFLKKQKIPFELIQYNHEEKGAAFASKATGIPLNQTIKTLAADLGNKQYILALMPGDKQLSLKLLAKACQVKRAKMADTNTAERITGYLVGGISPFGTRQKINAIMEQTLVNYNFVVINAGQRGIMLKMKPEHIIKALNCKITDIIQE